MRFQCPWNGTNSVLAAISIQDFARSLFTTLFVSMLLVDGLPRVSSCSCWAFLVLGWLFMLHMCYVLLGELQRHGCYLASANSDAFGAKAIYGVRIGAPVI